MWPKLNLITAMSRHAFVPALAALFLTTALPQTSQAMTTSETGLWRVTKSEISHGLGTLIIERVRPGEKATGASTFVVINKDKAYFARPAGDAASASGVRAVDYNALNSMKLVQIGRNVRAIDDCGARCRFGIPGDRMTVTFRTVNTGGESVESMLALK